ARHVASGKEYEDLYSAYVQCRMFDEARAFQSVHPAVSTRRLPRLIDEFSGPSGPSVLIPNDTASQLTRKGVNLQVPALVIVVARPFCHFCHDGFRDIEKDAKVRQALSNAAVWLVPADGYTGFGDVAEWNRQHPSERMSYAYTAQEWPMIDNWALPTFYFL